MEHYIEGRRSRFPSAPPNVTARAGEGLERAGERGLLSAVTSPPLPSQHESAAPLSVRAPDPEPGGRARLAVWQAVRCGLIVAAATAGVITGFSLRDPAGPLAPFATNGRMLLGVSANEGRLTQLVALAGGLALHALLAVVWASLFVAFAHRLRGARLWVAAALFALGAYGTSEYLLSPLLRLGHGARAYPPQLALLYAVLAVALVAGMRLANSGAVGAARSGSPGT
jgi:hypothetical protein